MDINIKVTKDTIYQWILKELGVELALLKNRAGDYELMVRAFRPDIDHQAMLKVPVPLDPGVAEGILGDVKLESNQCVYLNRQLVVMPHKRVHVDDQPDMMSDLGFKQVVVDQPPALPVPESRTPEPQPEED